MGCHSLRSQGSSLGVCPTFGAPTFALAAEWAWVMSRSCVGYCNSGISHSLSSPVPYRCLGLLGLASEDRFYFDSGGFPVADWLVAAIHSTDFPNCWLEQPLKGKCVWLSQFTPSLFDCPGRSPGLNVESGRSSRLGPQNERKGSGHLQSWFQRKSSQLLRLHLTFKLSSDPMQRAKITL